MTTYRPRYRPNRRSLLKGASIAAVGLTMMPRFSLAEEEKKLNFYNWDTYIGEIDTGRFRDGDRHRDQDGSLRRQ